MLGYKRKIPGMPLSERDSGGPFYILHGGDFRQMIGLPKCMEEIHRLIHFLHQMIKLLRCQGLGAITEGFFRIVVDLDHETVSSGCRSLP